MTSEDKYYKLDNPLDGYSELSNSSQLEFKNDVDLLCNEIKEEFFSKKISNGKLLRSKVIGIQGKWGVGKTSFINAVVDSLSSNVNGDEWYSKFDKNTNVINLNPWKFNKKDNLVEYFISEIRDKVEYSNDSQKASLEDIHSFNKYISLFNNKNISSIFTIIYMLSNYKKRFFGFMIGIGIVLLMLGVWKYNLLNGENLINSIQKVSVITELTLVGFWAVLGVFLFICYKIIEKMYKDISSSDIKEKIDNILDKNEQRYVCVIDDVDRLMDDQIYQVFTAIKEIVDFPNILFIITYDKDIINNVFSKYKLKVDENGSVCTTTHPFEKNSDDSNIFIDKIIHQEVNIKTYANNYIKDKLEGLNLSKSQKKIFDLKKDRDYRVIDYIFKRYTIRDVKKRLDKTLNTLVSTNKIVDINIPTFILLSLFKEKDIHSYEAIRDQDKYGPEKYDGTLLGYINTVKNRYSDNSYFIKNYYDHNHENNFGLSDFLNLNINNLEGREDEIKLFIDNEKEFYHHYHIFHKYLTKKQIVKLELCLYSVSKALSLTDKLSLSDFYYSSDEWGTKDDSKAKKIIDKSITNAIDFIVCTKDHGPDLLGTVFDIQNSFAHYTSGNNEEKINEVRDYLLCLTKTNYNKFIRIITYEIKKLPISEDSNRDFMVTLFNINTIQTRYGLDEKLVIDYKSIILEKLAPFIRGEADIPYALKLYSSLDNNAIERACNIIGLELPEKNEANRILNLYRDYAKSNITALYFDMPTMHNRYF